MKYALRELMGRPDYHALVAAGTLDFSGFNLELQQPNDFEDLPPPARLKKPIKIIPTPSAPLPFPPKPKVPAWPAWAKAIASQKRDGETGVGDTAERVIGPFGPLFKAAFKKLFEKDCGCNARKELWNLQYPYA